MFDLDFSFIVFLFFAVVLPFIINAFLAESRGKSVALMLLLTLIFSWIVTLALVVLPKVEIVQGETI